MVGVGLGAGKQDSNGGHRLLLLSQKSSGCAISGFSTIIFYMTFLKMMYTCTTHFPVRLQGFVQFLIC